MADSLLHAELLAACSALGYSDGPKYRKEPDCLETVKDLIRYLRKDDDSHEIRRALGDTRVVQTDLVPLVRDFSDDTELFDVVLRLLVNLTNPTLLLFREELPEEKVTRQQFLHLVAQQQAFKEAFAKEHVWTVLVKKLSHLLALEWEQRQEEDRLVIERVLILARNVLAVPAAPEEEKRTDDDASLHDQVLWAMHLAGFEDLLLYVASSVNEQDLCMHALEIVSLMLREQDPAQLAQADLQRSQTEKDKDEKELLATRQREAAHKILQAQKFNGGRHSRFGGTYSVLNMKSISDRDLISHRPLVDIQEVSFDRDKRPHRKPKNRVPLKNTDSTRRSTLAIRLYLQEFCVEFLNGAYNSIMYTVKDNLNRARAQEHDESYYLWAMRFFMEFNRSHNFKLELISETLSVPTFHYIQTNLTTYYEMMTTDKKKIPLWSRRMHRALRAYQELLMTLSSMDKSLSEEVLEASRVLKSKIFYVIEYRELTLILLQNFDELKMSASYLRDLVETAHIFLKLLETFCGKNRHVFVQKGAKKKKSKSKKHAQTPSAPLTEIQLEELWGQISDELSCTLQGEAAELPVMVPFDALSELSDDRQKEEAMRRINLLLRRKEVAQATGLLRAAREVWPEGDIFGTANIDASEEFLSLREIFMANLNPEEVATSLVPPDDDLQEIEDEKEERMEAERGEQELNFPEFVRRFAHTRVLQAYSRLLRSYAHNTAFTNHCILKIFHRLAWDSKLPAILFQASLFRVFSNAMGDPRRHNDEGVKEIVKFAKFIVRSFFKVAETNRKVFVELLFWKTNREAVEIECGYQEKEEGKKALKNAWLEEEEEELKGLFSEFQEAPLEGTEGHDIVDKIMENLIDQDRSRRAVIKKLKDLGLIKDSRDLNRKTINIRAPRQWTEEEEEELRSVFEENKEAIDVVGRILDHMTIRRPKHRVVEKILELGLVHDKKELRKKRPAGRRERGMARNIGERFMAQNQDCEESGSHHSNENSDAVESDSEDSCDDTEPMVKYLAPVTTPGGIAVAVNAALAEGNDGLEAVKWLAELLSETADDRAADGDLEPVPVLAVTDGCNRAMDAAHFQVLLRVLGIHPPANHQEMFWRIPSSLTVDGLRKRAAYLSQAMLGDETNLASEEPLEGEPVPTNPSRSDEMKCKKQSPNRKQLKSVKTTLVNSPKGELDIENQWTSRTLLAMARAQDQNDMLTLNRKQSLINGKKRICSDNEDPIAASSNFQPTTRVSKRSRLLTNEDLNDGLIVTENNSTINNEEKENYITSSRMNCSIESDSDDNQIGNSQSKSVDSDSDNERLVIVTKKRVRVIVESDDDD